MRVALSRKRVSPRPPTAPSQETATVPTRPDGDESERRVGAAVVVAEEQLLVERDMGRREAVAGAKGEAVNKPIVQLGWRNVTSDLALALGYTIVPMPKTPHHFVLRRGDEWAALHVLDIDGWLIEHVKRLSTGRGLEGREP